MSTIKWVNFLHIYQPAWQDPAIVNKVTNESYRFLVNSFKKYPHYKATINIAGTLIETLAELGYEDIINDIKKLISKKQIELTGSSHFHAFLPQLPEHEIKRQIILQEKTLKKFFNIKPQGFFLPEMAYSPGVGKVIKKMGYQWIILDPISTDNKPKAGIKYIDNKTDLTVVFRNRKLSRSYPPEAIYKLIKNNHDMIIITATDGEMYGHFHQDWQDHLKQIIESGKIEILPVSEYIKSLTFTEPVELRVASWETRSKQLKKNNPFSIWYNKSNPIHKDLWQLADLAIELVKQNRQDPNYIWARHHLDRGLASCSWWWASEVKTSVFAPLAWSPDEIQKGALELIKSIRSLENLPANTKIKAEKIHLNILENIWTKHWKTYGNSKK